MYDIQLSATMESKLNQLASDISGLVHNFITKEMSEYRENYEYMLRSPLCQKLLKEIEDLKRKHSNDATTSTSHKLDSYVSDSDGEFYKFDRAYVLTPPDEKKSDNIELEIEEEVEVTDDESGGEEEVVEVTDDESGGEETESGGEGSPHEEEEVVEVTDDESGGEETESGGEGSPHEEEEDEVTDDESGDEETESGGEGSPHEEDEEDEEEEVFEFEYNGKKYFATDEVNGILYANVDDDIGDEVGKIQNKNVVLF